MLTWGVVFLRIAANDACAVISVTLNKAPPAMHVPVGDGHELWVEFSGDPSGVPAVYLHGGPGAASVRSCHDLFAPGYWVCVYHQRGCGRSRYRDRLRNNTTAAAVRDVNRVRSAIGVRRWGLVMGGSWGASLALLYTMAYPHRVGSYVVRGISLLEKPFWSPALLDLYPERWEALKRLLPPGLPPGDTHRAIHRAIHRDRDRAVARAFVSMEMSALGVHPRSRARPRPPAPRCSRDEWDMATIASHFEAHRWFLPPRFLRERCGAASRVPGIFVHGRLDVICPLRPVWEGLLPRLPRAALWVVEGAGHSHRDPPIAAAMREASRRLLHQARGTTPPVVGAEPALPARLADADFSGRHRGWKKQE